MNFFRSIKRYFYFDDEDEEKFDRKKTKKNSRRLNLKKKEIWNWVFWFFLVFFLFLFFMGSQSEYIQNNDSSNSSNLNVPNSSNLNVPNSSSGYQNFDNFSSAKYPHWSHMPITYKIDKNCSSRLKNLVLLAFQKVKNETGGLVYYVPSDKIPNLNINCNPSENGNNALFLPIEDASCITDKTGSKLISHAEINIYGQGMVCGTGYPATEVHELLHTLGFVHSPHINNIMYPVSADSSSSCKINGIDSEYVSCLKNIYSNGKISGSCNNIDTSIKEGESNFTCTQCEGGWYNVKGTLSCCPGPNMKIDAEGYCNSE